MSEAEIAQAAGMEHHTWRRQERTAFRARVQLINPGERQRLYDAEQVHAYLAGRPVPVQPHPEERRAHPDDLLNDREAGAVLGVDASTVSSRSSGSWISTIVMTGASRIPGSSDRRHTHRSPVRTGARRNRGLAHCSRAWTTDPDPVAVRA